MTKLYPECKQIRWKQHNIELEGSVDMLLYAYSVLYPNHRHFPLALRNDGKWECNHCGIVLTCKEIAVAREFIEKVSKLRVKI